MNRLIVTSVVAGLLALFGCGGGSSNPSTSGNSATGNWALTLDGTNGQPTMMFTMAMNQSSNMMLTGNNINFTMSSPCFGSDTTMVGQMGMAGMGGMSAMSMTMTSAPGGSAQNVLQMQANMPAGMASASGSWTLTGNTSGCNSNSGTFTMTRMSQ